MFFFVLSTVSLLASFAGVSAQEQTACERLLELYVNMPRIIAESAMESECLAGRACLSFGHLILEEARQELVEIRKQEHCQKKKSMNFTKEKRCARLEEAPQNSVRALKSIYGKAAYPLADTFEENFSQLLAPFLDENQC